MPVLKPNQVFPSGPMDPKIRQHRLTDADIAEAKQRFFDNGGRITQAVHPAKPK